MTLMSKCRSSLYTYSDDAAVNDTRCKFTTVQQSHTK